MASCPTCGESLDAGGRCSSCGSGAAGVQLLDAGAAPITTENSVSRGGTAPTKWYLMLGAVLAGIVGWSILSSGPTADPADGETAVAEDSTSSSTSTTVEEEASTTSEAAEDDQASTTTQVDELEADEDTTPPSVPIGGTGLSLVGGNPLQILDLDTGEITETKLRNVAAVALVGDRLVINSESSGQLRSLDINDLDGDPQVFESPNGYLFAFGSSDAPNTIVAIGDNYNNGPSLSRYTYDVVDGTLLDESSVTIDSGFYGGFVDIGDFTTPRSGGVYRVNGSSYELAGPGRVVAQGDGLVLVEVCDEVLVCEMAWHDGASYAVVELPIPDDISDGEVLANGRLLRYRSLTGWEASLFDLETGDVVASGLDDLGFGASSVSTNGSMVAYLKQGSVYVLDVDTKVEHRVNAGSGYNNGYYYAPLLIDSP